MPRTPARHCGNYSPGHTPHFIQGLRSVEKKWFQTEVEYLGSNIFQLTLEDGQILTRFNHEPGRIIEYLVWFGQGAAWFQDEFYLLGIETEAGKALFNMGKKPLKPCCSRFS
jgi:glutamine cyclotransferase